MTKSYNNKFTAIWLSHSSVSDFLKCPRLYYLHNLWKNESGKKVNIVSPYMSLGSAVHQVLEPLANLKTEDRFNKNLLERFNEIWVKYAGKNGGFETIEQEEDFKKRGEKMLQNVLDNKTSKNPICQKTVKFYSGDFIPNIYLSEKENIILCGLVDWVEYLPETDSLKVIDFKTGKNEENEDSYQLPIYKILVENLQNKRKVTAAAYWYLDRDKCPKDIEIFDEDIEEIKKKILEVGIEIKKRKPTLDFECKYKEEGMENCKYCNDFELIFNSENIPNQNVVYLGEGEYKQDLYFIKK